MTAQVRHRLTKRFVLALPWHPATAHWKDLADKTTGWLAAEIGCKLGIFLRSDEATQRNLSFQAFLKARIGLHLSGEVSRVVDEVLCDCIYLDIVDCDFHANGLNVRELRTTSGAVGRCAFHAAQR